jgi:hypothetical protein
MGKIERDVDGALWEKFMNPEECIELDIIGVHQHSKFKSDFLKDLYPIDSYFFDSETPANF